ncbi:MAG TPA: cytochrome b/b6 domain-containing protein [Candidatus Limnocylindrales bacterium]|nr:cytochrome b/b6 domain-containing protein [Candidatus Limnocylindrales bacterium]
MSTVPLAYRHNRITRLTHWANAFGLMILLMSGLMIFNAHPHLYWGHTSEPDKAFLSIGADDSGGDPRGYVEVLGRRIDTTGVLGLQQTADGPSQRAFPSWLTVPGYYSLAGARRWHFFFGWFFTINGLLYIAYNFAVGHLRKFFFTPRDAAKVPAMIAYYLKLRKTSPQEGEYNPLQKMAYTSVFVMLAPLILSSGMAMSPQLNVTFNWMPALLGGRQSARTIHFILAFGILFFVFGHVFMVITQGFFNNMRSMITGWYREKIPSQDRVPMRKAEPKPEIAKTPELEPMPVPQPVAVQAAAATEFSEDKAPDNQSSPIGESAMTNLSPAQMEDRKDV